MREKPQVCVVKFLMWDDNMQDKVRVSKPHVIRVETISFNSCSSPGVKLMLCFTWVSLIGPFSASTFTTLLERGDWHWCARERKWKSLSLLELRRNEESSENMDQCKMIPLIWDRKKDYHSDPPFFIHSNLFWFSLSCLWSFSPKTNAWRVQLEKFFLWYSSNVSPQTFLFMQ